MANPNAIIHRAVWQDGDDLWRLASRLYLAHSGAGYGTLSDFRDAILAQNAAIAGPLLSGGLLAGSVVLVPMIGQ